MSLFGLLDGPPEVRPQAAGLLVCTACSKTVALTVVQSPHTVQCGRLLQVAPSLLPDAKASKLCC